MNDKVDVSDIEKKISKIMELTGASKDKAIVALHDCANELDKAIDMILEGDSINESEWKRYLFFKYYLIAFMSH